MAKIIRNLFFILGVTSTLAALIISLGKQQLALTNVVILLIIIFQLINSKGKLVFYRYKLIIYLLFFVFVISSIGSILSLPATWSVPSMVGTIKFTFMLLPLILIFNDSELIDYSSVFFKGLYVSACIQLIWELLELIFFYVLHLSLNQIVFGNILGVQTGHTWLFIINNQFRPSGVSWEPANLSLALIIGFILSKNFIGKVLFATGTLLSTSRTGIVLLMICLMIYIIKSIMNIPKDNKITFKLSKVIIGYIGALIMSLILIFLVEHSNLIDILNSTFTRFSSGINLADSSSQQHSNYYWQAFDILSYSSVSQILFGYGTFVAGFPFSKYFNIFVWLNDAWTPESDVITILIGNGLIGFFLYYKFMYNVCLKNRLNWDYFMIAFVILIAGFMYIYIRGSWSFLICLLLYNKLLWKRDMKEIL